MAADLYPYVINGARIMIFVDGENLAIRYGNMLSTKGVIPLPRVQHKPNVAVWTNLLNPQGPQLPGGMAVIRKYYYTSVQGDEPTVEDVQDWLKDVVGFESPRVFKKVKGRPSKQ